MRCNLRIEREAGRVSFVSQSACVAFAIEVITGLSARQLMLPRHLSHLMGMYNRHYTLQETASAVRRDIMCASKCSSPEH